MRVERTYYRGSAGRDPVRADIDIYEDETHFCEDPECEAKHDDPSTLWDSRSNRIIAVAHGLDAAQRILAALQAVEERSR